MSLALHLWHASAPKLSLDDCENVLDALAKLGYVLAPGGDAGQHVSTGEYVNLAKAITRIAPVGHNDALAAFTALAHLQYAIKKPAKEAA